MTNTDRSPRPCHVPRNLSEKQQGRQRQGRDGVHVHADVNVYAMCNLSHVTTERTYSSRGESISPLGLPRDSNPCGNFSNTTIPILLRPTGPENHVVTICICDGTENHTRDSSFDERQISVFIRPVLGDTCAIVWQVFGPAKLLT